MTGRSFAEQYWNGAGGPGINGGDGVWDRLSANWTDAAGTTNTIWTSVDVVFAGTAGTVTVDASFLPASAASITFMTSGYVLTGDAIQLREASTLIGGAAATARIDSALTGSGGFTKFGTGTVVLGGSNTYTGATAIGAGRLLAGDNSVFSANSATTINSGGTLDLGGFTQTINAVTLNGGTIRNGALLGSLTSQGGRIEDIISTSTATIVGGTTTLDGNNGVTINMSGGTLRVVGTLQSGDVLMTGGALDVSGILDGTVDLGSGAILSGTGTVRNVDAFGGSLVSSSAGTLTMAALSMNGSASLNVDTSTGKLPFKVISDVILDGTLNLTDPAPIAIGVTRLIDYGSSFINNGFSIGTVPSGTLSADLDIQTVIPGQINLLNSGGQFMASWNAAPGGPLSSGGSGTWTYGNGNWNTNDGTYWVLNGSLFAVFQGTPGTVTVDNSGGAIGALGMQFAVSGYQVTGDAITLSNAQSIIRVGDGTADGASYVATIAASLTGSGGLRKTDLGTLVLSGGNNYTGATVVEAGTLHAGAFRALSQRSETTVMSGGTLDFGGQTQIVDHIILAGGTLTNGALIGDVTSSGGAISTLTGGASVTVTGGTTTLTGTNNFTGPTIVNGGTLVVDGTSRVSELTVNSGGTLSGTGVVGATVINGGTIAPGDATSTLAIDGDLTLTSAAHYMVNVSDASATNLSVSSRATLGGATVNATFAAGSYITRQYTIVDANHGVIGTFSTQVNTNLPSNFTSTLSYATNKVYLNLALNYDPPTPPSSPEQPSTPQPPASDAPGFGGGLNGNQRNVAATLVNYFDTTGGIPLAFGALTPGGLTQASGETATGAQQATFDAMTQFMGLITDPSAAGRSDAGAGAALGFATAPRDPRQAFGMATKAMPAPAFEASWRVWAAGFGGSRSTDGNAALGANDSRSSIAGVAVGADYRLAPDTLLGFAMAGGGTSFSTAGAGSGRSDLFQAGAFVRHDIGPAYVTAAAAYGWQDVTTDRMVGLDRLHAEFNANAYSGRIEIGDRFMMPWQSGIGLTPYAAAQVTAFDLPAYAEQAAGASLFALNYAAKTATATRSELGLRADKSVAMQDAMLTLRGRAAWAHDFDRDRSVAATFQSLPGTAFTVNGARQAAHTALTSASAEVAFMTGVSVAATFEGEFSDVTQSYAGKGVVRYAW